jgi:hypothetical protein
MFHVTPEGGWLHWGFNFYPWSEHKYSVGFRFFYRRGIWWMRYAPHVGKLYFRRMETS